MRENVNIFLKVFFFIIIIIIIIIIINVENLLPTKTSVAKKLIEVILQLHCVLFQTWAIC